MTHRYSTSSWDLITHSCRHHRYHDLWSLPINVTVLGLIVSSLPSKSQTHCPTSIPSLPTTFTPINVFSNLSSPPKKPAKDIVMDFRDNAYVTNSIGNYKPKRLVVIFGSSHLQFARVHYTRVNEIYSSIRVPKRWLFVLHWGLGWCRVGRDQRPNYLLLCQAG